MPEYNEDVGGSVAIPPVTVKVWRDDSGINPRTEWDNLGTFAFWHRRYKYGDEQPHEQPVEWLKKNAPKGSVVLPVFMIDHSGISFSTGDFGDPWDSGQVGYIIRTADEIRAEWKVKRISKRIRALVTRALEEEIKIYNAYVNGDVWGFTVEGGNLDMSGESCGGFYGNDLDGMKAHLPKVLHEALEAAWQNRYDT